MRVSDILCRSLLLRNAPATHLVVADVDNPVVPESIVVHWKQLIVTTNAFGSKSIENDKYNAHFRTGCARLPGSLMWALLG